MRLKGVEGRWKIRNKDHETRFCGNVGGGGLRRRIYSRLCPRRLWAWRRVCEPRRLRAQSYHSPGITSAADARLPKPDSGPARGTFAAPRHQRAVGAKPLWGDYVATQPLTPSTTVLSVACSRAAVWMATLASPGPLPILLLVGSNLFMTLAWYDHLRFKDVPLAGAIVASWLIAFLEYCLAVPANRWGSAVYTAAQL